MLAGWWLALGHLISGVAMCLTIIGIPLGLANFKLIPVSLTPFGRDIVDIDQARRMGLSRRRGGPHYAGMRRSRASRRRPSIGVGRRVALSTKTCVKEPVAASGASSAVASAIS